MAGRGQDPHAEGDALLSGLDAGKLRYVGGTNVCQGEHAVKFFAVTASRFSEQQILPRQIGRLNGGLEGQGMAGVGKQEDLAPCADE